MSRSEISIDYDGLNIKASFFHHPADPSVGMAMDISDIKLTIDYDAQDKVTQNFI